MPAYGYQPGECAITLNDINLAIKFEKLIEKANKYFKLNDSKKLLEVMLDMKHETDLPLPPCKTYGPQLKNRP